MKTTSFLIALILAVAIQAVPVSAASKVGTVDRIQGSAAVVIGNERRALQQGSPIHENDVVTTGAGGRLKLRFIDESTVILGEKAKLRLDNLIFDTATQDGKQAFKIWGAFRFTSGLIAKKDSTKVTLSMPVATIGIRGTDLIAGLYASGMPPGQKHYGVMLVSGAISVGNDKGSVILDEPGEGTFLPEKGDKAPVPPIIWPNNAMTEAFGSVTFK